MFKTVGAYAACNVLDNARALIDIDTRDEIRRYILEEMDEETKFEMVSEIDDNIYRMEDLDSTFDYMSVSRILDALSDIDPSDRYFNRYFNECRAISSDDMLELTRLTLDEIATHVRDNYFDMEFIDQGITDIMDKRVELKRQVREQFHLYREAHKLFDTLAEQDITALLTVLRNGGEANEG